MSKNYFDPAIVISLGVPIKARPLPHVQSWTWALPWFQEVKINVGAVAMGSPGTAGTGAIARNHCSEVIGIHLYRMTIERIDVMDTWGSERGSVLNDDYFGNARRILYDERVSTEMQRFRLRYFRDQSSKLPTPIPIPPKYHDMSEEEATKVEEDLIA
ncbi:hypothetical protein GIB67_002396, partial [Kingdonia uniflora]